jgi:3-oxocholest-4-en-26-oate---CoA ligase
VSGTSFASVFDAVAASNPDRDALVGAGDRRFTWREFTDRAARLAWHLQHELGLAPRDRVAIHLTNRHEYLETFAAALTLGGVPLNVDFRYSTNDVHHVLDESDAKVVVHGPGSAKLLKTAIRRIAKGWRPALIEVGPAYEHAVAGAAPPSEWTPRPPDGDDVIFVYGRTNDGSPPRALVWRNDDLFGAVSRSASARPVRVLVAAPLTHSTGLFPALAALSAGGTLVLVDREGIDTEAIWDAVERERVEVLALAGDAIARPLLAALEADPARWDLGSLRAITSSGAPVSPGLVRELHARLPEVAAAAVDATPGPMVVGEHLRVIDEATGLDVRPGDDVVGRVARGGHIPLGYYRDSDRTAAAFRVVGGTRYVVTDDYATVDADGVVQLVDQHATVDVAQVERRLRTHPSVEDCVVVRVPDHRKREQLVALVQVEPTHYLDEVELVAWSRAYLDAELTPSRFLLVDSVSRSPSGDVDHDALRRLAAERLARG